MTITQIDSSTQALSSTKSETLDSKIDTDSRPQGEEFGQVMAQVQTPKGQIESPQKTSEASGDTTAGVVRGQEMAEFGQGMPMLFNIHTPVTGNWSLKAVTLGPTLNVITPEKAAPDDQSLEAFARSQGLDETAVQWLMGGKTTPAARSEIASGSVNQASSTPEVILSSVTTPTTLSPILDDTPVPSLSSSGLAGTLTSLSMTNPQQSKANLPPTNDAGIVFNSTLTSLGTSSTLQVQGHLPATDAEISTSASLAAGAALLTMIQTAETSKSAVAPKVAAADSAEMAEVQIQLMREPMPAAVWMLRNGLSSEATAARRIEKDTPSLSELDLSTDISPELLDSLMSGLGENTGNAATVASPAHTAIAGVRLDTGSTGQQAASSSSDAQNDAESSAAQRSENIHNLAEKMGQAVGQRMLSEIEKGQWHLKLQLRPATLGHIEVEMRMLSGEMDAVFTAPQALTRELLQDGLSKLKDTLNQMGMNVASMQVGDGQSRQRGGDSTPNKSSKSADLIENDSKSTISTTTWVPRQKMGEDGWDVLV